jgi:hypothetical protein
MQSDEEMGSRLDGLIEAIEAKDKEAIMSWIRGEQFTLVSLSNDEDWLPS